MKNQDKTLKNSAAQNLGAAGHRQRLRERFCRAGLNALQDYEAVELVLSYAIPRRDVKPLAKELLHDFGSIEGLMDAPMHRLIEEHGMGMSSALLIRLIREMCTKYLEQRARNTDVLNAPDAAEDFVRMKLGGCQSETLMTIFLNSHNHIISYELTPGTVNRASIYVRELAKRAVIGNARCYQAVRAENGSFSDYLWAFSEGKSILYEGHGVGAIPVSNGLSARISKDLKKRGFTFVGPITIYAFLQACGVINDHDWDCPCGRRIISEFPTVRKPRDHEVQ